MNPSIEKPPHFPNLETERLALRQLEASDAEFVFRHFSDPAFTRYLMDAPPFTCLNEARQMIDFFKDPEGKSHNRWGIVRKTDN